jgi:hypothetical protein
MWLSTSLAITGAVVAFLFVSDTRADHSAAPAAEAEAELIAA